MTVISLLTSEENGPLMSFPIDKGLGSVKQTGSSICAVDYPGNWVITSRNVLLNNSDKLMNPAKDNTQRMKCTLVKCERLKTHPHQPPESEEY